MATVTWSSAESSVRMAASSPRLRSTGSGSGNWSSHTPTPESQAPAFSRVASSVVRSSPLNGWKVPSGRYKPSAIQKASVSRHIGKETEAVHGTGASSAHFLAGVSGTFQQVNQKFSDDVHTAPTIAAGPYPCIASSHSPHAGHQKIRQRLRAVQGITGVHFSGIHSVTPNLRARARRSDTRCLRMPSKRAISFWFKPFCR